MLAVPLQAEAELTVSVKDGLTDILTVFVLVHPKALVPVTVYVVDAVGVAITEEPVDVFNDEAGDQV